MKDRGMGGLMDGVPPPGQKRGLDWCFASERPSNSVPQTPDCLFLAPVGAVKQGQGQSTSKLKYFKRPTVAVSVHSINFQYIQTDS